MDKNLSLKILLGITLVFAIIVPFFAKEEESYEVVDLVSCNQYSEEFLSSKGVGFNNKEQCQTMFIALHKQYVDECTDMLFTTKLNDNNAKRLINKCIYLSIEKDQLPLDRDYEIFMSKQ